MNKTLISFLCADRFARFFSTVLLGLCFTHSVSANEIKAYEAEAAMAANQLLKQLGGALKKEMGSTGPAGAIDVCRTLAPAMAAEISREKGWRVTRVGTKVRNPLLGMPDVWEQDVLSYFKRRAAGGEPFKAMSHSEIVDEPQGRYYRYMKPLAVQPICLTCHGDRDQMTDQVRDRLKNDYPHDQAVGYQAGDLRGAISIKQPLFKY